MPEILLATINAKWIHPSLALRLLKSNLGQLEERSGLAEFNLRQPVAEQVDAISKARPRILAFSVSIWNHAATLALLRALDALWAASGPRPLVVLGGPEAANLDEKAPLLAECDWLLRGEGDLAFRELCSALLAGGEPRPGGAIDRVRRVQASRNGSPAAFAIAEASPVDPAAIDSGYRLYTEEDLAHKLCYVEASRGCPFGCEFCLSSLDRRVREFPLEGFFRDMEGLLARGARSFKFLDRTFNLDAVRAAAIMEFFLPRFRPDMFVHFEILPSIFPRRLLDIACRFPAGSLRLEAGIQTLDPAVAANIGRRSQPEAELDTLRHLRDHGSAIVHADLIAGLPGETFGSFARGFDLLFACGPDEIQLGMLKRLPGTPIARHDIPFSMRYSSDPPYEVVSTSSMDAGEVARLRNFSRFWELIINRGNFPGFTEAFLGGNEDSAFGRFLGIADGLLGRFGRSWGIDRSELRAALEPFARIRLEP
ncbi:MAG: radical SAM protein [Spirochaetota bacterium]